MAEASGPEDFRSRPGCRDDLGVGPADVLVVLIVDEQQTSLPRIAVCDAPIEAFGILAELLGEVSYAFPQKAVPWIQALSYRVDGRIGRARRVEAYVVFRPNAVPFPRRHHGHSTGGMTYQGPQRAS